MYLVVGSGNFGQKFDLHTVKPLYFAPHLIGDFRKLIKIAKFNGRKTSRKYVKL